MLNLMAREMSKRYEEFINTPDLEERAAKVIYFWVMSSLESFLWGARIITSIDASLYASKRKMCLVICDSTGEEHEFVHYPTYNCDSGKLPTILQKFVEIFNNIEYPLTDKISYPVFHAHSFGIWDNPYIKKKYNGYYHINITINLFPNHDNDPTNSGRHS